MSDSALTHIRVALIGNPNSGKSTVFNVLTGLSQKTGNFPGVTVEKSVGRFVVNNVRNHTRCKIELLDLPGTYSLFVKSPEELETLKALLLSNDNELPEKVVIVADATNLRRSLILCYQSIASGFETILALNMLDLLEESQLQINVSELEKALQIPVIPISAKQNKGFQKLKEVIALPIKSKAKTEQEIFFNQNLIVANAIWFQRLPKFTAQLEQAKAAIKNEVSNAEIWVEHWVSNRYKAIDVFIDKVLEPAIQTKSFLRTRKIDQLLTHRIWGFPFFFLILLAIFQLIFSFATIPMDWIDSAFGHLSSWLSKNLPENDLSSMLADGIVPGVGGVVMFVPQIAILFGIIAILEDTGYMARVTYLMDKLFRKFGLNGRSVIPLVSSVACAVPAIISARTIKNTKERLITILITPLMSCSARIPVYVLICGLVIPNKKWLGFIDYRALAMVGLYLSGFLAALLAAFVFKLIIKSQEKAYFILEMPVYRWPKTQVVLQSTFKSVRLFVVGAGKIIVSIAIILWATATYGPKERMNNINQKYDLIASQLTNEDELNSLDKQKSAEKLENSFIGILGKTIQPLIAPLGYDWKIGIGLITSFAAREVFIGSMATIYGISADDDEDQQLLKQRMANEIYPSTGLPVYTFAAGMSLLVFYAFAMQCMSTLAVSKRETGTWKWPIVQLIYMSALAYLSAWAVFQLLS